MRGLQPLRSANAIYLVIKHGCLCQESKTMRDGYHPVELIDRDTHEPYFRYIKPWGGVRQRSPTSSSARVFDGVPYKLVEDFHAGRPGRTANRPGVAAQQRSAIDSCGRLRR